MDGPDSHIEIEASYKWSIGLSQITQSLDQTKAELYEASKEPLQLE